MLSDTYEFKMTKEEYEKYEAWCKNINEVHDNSAIGGSHTIHITPTSVGDIVVITCRKLRRDEAGNPIIKRPGKKGHLRYKTRIEKLKLRDI